MATTAIPRRTRPLKRRRIIERPRLFALLDESNARVRTLVAPAGYGKTTLAEQWVGRAGRRGAWYTARSASTDVAALALGVARTASELVPGCDERLREHLRAVPNPGERVDVLAEILGEELADWGSDDWLVLDDYHELAAAPEAELFVEDLISDCPLQILIASRQRPAWASGRSILYGEILELNQTALAMDSREAAEVLVDRSAQSASGLVALANGWPAVIGLASVSSAEIEAGGEVPDSLYRFFAEEVFAALGEEVRAGLATLAGLPLLDRELVSAVLLGQAELVLTSSLEVGILVERGPRLEIHPLARSFLDERSEQLGFTREPSSAATALAHYRSRRDWDAAFELIARQGPVSELEPLVLDALDELLDTARLSTIETWCELASTSRLDAPTFSVARAEVSLRQGHHAEAQTFAESAAVAPSPLTFRALSVAGRAAHLGSREDEALDLYKRAEDTATTDSDRRDALWGQLMCLIDLERPEAIPALEELTAGVGFGDAREVVRAAAHGLYSQLRFGVLDLSQADVAAQLLPVVGDPLVGSGFQNVYATTLALSARYEDAREVAVALLATAERYQFSFAVPYALCSVAIAETGLRNWSRAAQHLNRAICVARGSSGAHAEHLCLGVRFRLLAQQHKHEVALALPLPTDPIPILAIRAELMTSRALVLCVAGRFDEAMSIVEDFRGSTQAIEPIVLCAAVDAIAAVRRQPRRAVDLVAQLEDVAFTTGGVDLLVTAYRSAPEILALLLRASTDRERIIGLVRRVRDEDLARAVGQPIDPAEHPRAQLSRREREVYDLLCQGLSNRQIGEILFITESTVKVHAHHIYDKLGMRSRAALAVDAALRRSTQATSATGGSDSDSAS